MPSSPAGGVVRNHCVRIEAGALPAAVPGAAMLDGSGEAVFSAVLRANQLRARISDNATYCDNWTEREPTTEHGTFHLIDSGVCWVRSEALDAPVRLAAGDLIVFPMGAAHTLSGTPDGRSAPEARFTSMLCGEFEFATGKRNAIVDALPPCFVVREQDSCMQCRQLAQLMRKFGNAAQLKRRRM